MTSGVAGTIGSLGPTERLWWAAVVICIMGLAALGHVQTGLTLLGLRNALSGRSLATLLGT